MSTISNAKEKTVNIIAVRGTFADVTYYMATLSLSECYEQLSIARTEEASTFAERVQRRLDTRRAEKRIYQSYLKRPGTRFFNSLVVVLMPKRGARRGYYRFEPYRTDDGRDVGDVGTLEILSDIDRIVIDGQHRLHALRLANEHSREPDYDKQLAFAEIRVPVVFLTFDDVGGNFDKAIDDPNLHTKVSNKSRKLFVDLNKDVKKVDKNSLLVLDDSDFSAVSARRLIEENSELERYTKWSDAGTTLADVDPYYTNIFLLDQFVEILLGDTLVEIEERGCLVLELEEQRERAIKKIFLAPHPVYELPPRKMIEEFFERVSFFHQWKDEIRRILGDDPRIQPIVTDTNRAQKDEIRGLHKKSLLGTVAGQRAAFIGVVESFEHFDGDPESNWRLALDRLSEIHDAGILDRSNPLWLELLVKAGNTMKLNTIRPSAEVISCLIRRSDESSLGQINPAKGRGTKDTVEHYLTALTSLAKDG